MGSIVKTACRDGPWRLLLLIPLLALLHALPVRAGEAHLLSVKGAIGPASEDCLLRGLARAKEAASLSAEAALRERGIDIAAADVADLLEQPI